MLNAYCAQQSIKSRACALRTGASYVRMLHTDASQLLDKSNKYKKYSQAGTFVPNNINFMLIFYIHPLGL